MRASSYQRLIDGLDDLNAPEESKKVFAEWLRRNAALDGVSLQRNERVGFASQLLAKREDRAVIRERLMNRFHVSRSQAYADIAEAEQSVQKTVQRLDGGLIKWNQ